MIGWRACVHTGLAVLTAVVLVSALAPVAFAGISSSAHDFSGFGFVDSGACSACHYAHSGGDDQALWPRDLTDERTEFDQGDTPIETPNYIRGATILCYDCHDNQNIADVDDDPNPAFWGNSIHGGPDGYPQDIAYDDHPGVQGSGDNDVGYYELIDGSLPSGASGGGPTDGSPTGGHYWMSAPDNGGSPEYEQGDKLDCNICHDPHSRVTGTNQVMFRTSTSDGMGGTVDLGDGRNASFKTRAHTGIATDTGRNMCAACHRYSDEPNDPGATANGIPTTTVEMWNVPLPQPPATDPNHAYDANATIPCTLCHKHNKIVAACDDCHGYPPDTGAHISHIKGAGWIASDPDIYDFGCLGGTCHPSTANSHPQSANPTTTIDPAFVDVVFDPAWNPDALVYETAGVETCSQLYCHSNALVENGEFAGDNGSGEAGASGLGEYVESSGSAAFYGPTIGRTIRWSDTFAGLDLTRCGACHGKRGVSWNPGDPGVPPYNLKIGATTTTEDVSPPDYFNAGTQSVTDGATIYNTTGANTHFIHVYKINSQDPTYGMWGGAGCGCHTETPVQRYDDGDGDGFFPVSHVNRRVDIGDANAVDATGSPSVQGRGCANECHNGATPADWGDNLAAAGVENDSCVFVCHGKGNTGSANYYGGSPGGRITKLAGSGGLDSDDKYMQSGHGLPSGTYASGRAAANLACDVCHLLDDRGGTPATRSYHYERVATATGNPNASLAPGQPGANPYWLIAPYEDNPDGLCETCHDPATETDAHNHTAQGMITHADYNPKYDGADTGQWSQGSTFDPNCIHCHDPHGESNWSMLYDGDAEKSSHQSTLILSGPNVFEGSRFGVTIDQADTHGFPPGDYIPPIVTPISSNQTAVTMLGNTNGTDFRDGNGNGICEVCHTVTTFNRSDGTSPGGLHPTSPCSDCHEHQDSYAPSSCEGCHGCPTSFDPDGGLSLPPAPDVMGDGVSVTGVGGVLDDRGIPLGPQPCDDGSWGYFVNGHGAMTWNAQSRTVECLDCHELLGHHADGTLNTLDWPGKAGTTRTTNTSHLVPAFLPAGTAQARQLAFDDYCTNQCHTDAREMRHSAPSAPSHPQYDGIMQFGSPGQSGGPTSNVDPKGVRGGWNLWGDDVLTATDGSDASNSDEKYTPGVGPGGGDPTNSYWFPWTISDHTNSAAAPPYYGTCVSCHDPHGAPTLDQSRGLNHMNRYDWKRPPSTDPNFNCNSQCHR